MRERERIWFIATKPPNRHKKQKYILITNHDVINFKKKKNFFSRSSLSTINAIGDSKLILLLNKNMGLQEENKIKTEQEPLVINWIQ